MRLALPVLAALMVLAVLAPAAQAWSPGAWQTSLDIARAAWPDSTCAGQEQVTVTPGLPGTEYGDAYQDGSCRVNIRAGLPDYALCLTMVHEFGHLAGRTHADIYDHEGIMAPGLAAYTPCMAALPPVPLAPRTQAAWLFHLPPARCTLASATPTRRLYRCGHHAHALVTLAAGAVTGAERA